RRHHTGPEFSDDLLPNFRVFGDLGKVQIVESQLQRGYGRLRSNGILGNGCSLRFLIMATDAVLVENCTLRRSSSRRGSGGRPLLGGLAINDRYDRHAPDRQESFVHELAPLAKKMTYCLAKQSHELALRCFAED